MYIGDSSSSYIYLRISTRLGRRDETRMQGEPNKFLVRQETNRYGYGTFIYFTASFPAKKNINVTYR